MSRKREKRGSLRPGRLRLFSGLLSGGRSPSVRSETAPRPGDGAAGAAMPDRGSSSTVAGEGLTGFAVPPLLDEGGGGAANGDTADEPSSYIEVDGVPDIVVAPGSSAASSPGATTPPAAKSRPARPSPLRLSAPPPGPVGTVVGHHFGPSRAASRQAQSRARQDAADFLGGISLMGRKGTRLSARRSTLVQADDEDLDASLRTRVTKVRSLRGISLEGTRVLFTTAGGSPLLAFSILPYHKPKRSAGKKARSHNLQQSIGRSVQGRGLRSYRHLLDKAPFAYDPMYLDDPDLRFGKHMKVLNLPGYTTSVNLYAKPSDLKKELNQCFREKFPEIRLTLSKLRSLKQDMVDIAFHQCHCELSTVAMAHLYYELLVLKPCINKANRKLYAAACLLFAAKLNEPRDLTSERCQGLLKAIEERWKVSPVEVLEGEVHALVALEFNLQPHPSHILAHMQRIQQILPEPEP